jgi:polar amino acid transport system permease protein
MEFLTTYWPSIVGGLLTTVRICALSILMGLALGLGLALIRRLQYAPLEWICRCYIELFRGTPILIQLFLLYYVGPNFGLMLDPEPAGIVGLALYGAAYFAEIFRAGFESIPKGQVEAAASLGIGKIRILWRIILPQMAVLVMPPTINQSIILLKDSAVLSIITVPELTKVTSKIINETFASTEPLLLLGALYWVMVELLSRCGAGLEKRFTRYMHPSSNQ